MDRWLVLEPQDTLAVRDGRAFDAGVQATARATIPQPATVAGAIGAAFGAPPGAGADPACLGVEVPREIRGPVTVRWSRRGWLPLWPMPQDVVFRDDQQEWTRLGLDESCDGVEHDLGPLRLFEEDGEAKARWWAPARLRSYLNNEVTSSWAPVAGPWSVERRVGLARTADRTAAEGMLYAIEHLRPAGQGGVPVRVGLAALCVDAPERPLRPVVPLGGEGRRATVHDASTMADPIFPDAPKEFPGFPDAPKEFPGGRLLLYLATPAVFAEGWRPSDADLRGGDLVAAAVSGPEVIAMARPDRRTGAVSHSRLIWAAAAGSVYLLRFPDDRSACLAAEFWHGTALPQADATLRTAGFGLALVGRW